MTFNEQNTIENAIAELLNRKSRKGDIPATKEPTPEYAIVKKGRILDLSRIDFDKLKEDFKEATHKSIEIADLRCFVERKLEIMLKENKTRSSFIEKF